MVFVIDDDVSVRESLQLLLLVPRQRASRVHDDWRERHVFLAGNLFEQLVATKIGQLQVHHHAVVGRRFELLERFAGGANRRDLHLVAAEKLPDAVPLTRIVVEPAPR